jgi:hypothetical protein
VRPHTPPRRRRRTAAGLAAIAVASFLATAGGTLPASAAELSGVISDVEVSPTNPRLGTQVRTTIDWCVPDGTQAGDTFSLTLSEYLRSLPPGFSLTDPADEDQVVATATISSTDPAVVTFTMTQYAETHSNVCGSAFIQSGFDNGLTPGETVPFESEANDGTKFVTDVTPTGGGDGPDGDLDEAFKFGRLSADQGHTDPNDAAQWYVVSPRGPLSSVTITDNPAGGMNIDCASVDLLQGTRTETNIDGTSRPTIITPVSCTADSVSVTVGPIPAGQAVRLGFRVDLDEATGDGAHEFENTATVVSTEPGGDVRTDNPTRTLVSSSGGGGGEGDNEPSVDIEKWSTTDGATAGDFDEEPGKRVETGTPVPVTMTITNDGEDDLVDVVVTDKTVSGPAMSGLTCDFSPLGGPATGTTWDGPFLVGDAFECTGTVPAMESATLHTDEATVTGTGDLSGTGVTDTDPFNTATPPVPSIDIEKWSTADGYPGGDFDTAPGKAVDVETPVDVTFTITNDGEEALTDVTVGDTTDAGPEITGLTCDFSPLGGPATGTTWDGPFAVGDAFECTATVPGMSVGTLHSDTADVVGTGVESGREVDDTDPFHVTTPEPEPAIGIVKGDDEGNAGDTAAEAVTLPTGTASLVFTVTNPGTEPLVDVVVSDRVVKGGTVTDLSCTFPDGSTGTEWSGPFAVGDAFECTASLSGVAAGSDHEDVASVSAVGEVSGSSVDDDDPYFAERPTAGGLAVTGTDGVLTTAGLAFGLLLVGAAVFAVGRRRGIRVPSTGIRSDED